MDMYFIALVAPEEINKQVLKWKQLMRDRFGCAIALRSPAHITLIPPFWLNLALEPELIQSISSFAGSQTSFEIELQNFSFFKPRVIFIAVGENVRLQQLQKDLVDHLLHNYAFPVKKEERPFHPHVTIATRDLHKKTFYEAWEIFRGKKYNAEWQASGISVLRHNKKNWDVVFTSQFQF